MRNLEPTYIFVYGTLRPPRADTPPADSRYHPEIARYIHRAQPATLAGAELYDLGAYPAALPGTGTLHGDLLTVHGDALPIADRIEGHPTFYKRVEVTVQTRDGPITAWVYWGPPGIEVGRRRIRGGDWFARTAQAEEELMKVENATENKAKTEEESAAAAPPDETLRALVRRFAESACSWVSTVRPDARAHSAPMWHVWLRGRIYLVTQSGAVKTVNIATNPSVVVTHPDPMSPIIIEGWAIEAPHMRDALQPLFQQKYDWNITTDAPYDTVIEITPTRLIAWGEAGEGRWSGADVLRA